jgi:hypothetical protein
MVLPVSPPFIRNPLKKLFPEDVVTEEHEMTPVEDTLPFSFIVNISL